MLRWRAVHRPSQHAQRIARPARQRPMPRHAKISCAAWREHAAPRLRLSSERKAWVSWQVRPQRAASALLFLPCSCFCGVEPALHWQHQRCTVSTGVALSAPALHWQHRCCTGSTGVALAAPALHWQHWRCTGSTGVALAAPLLHWQHRRFTGSTGVALTSPALHWQHRRCTGSTGVASAAEEIPSEKRDLQGPNPKMKRLQCPPPHFPQPWKQQPKAPLCRACAGLAFQHMRALSLARVWTHSDDAQAVCEFDLSCSLGSSSVQSCRPCCARC
eukprot:218471-Chlamydomonas_euryale.AAC.3